ncbi:hypothetical protein GT037_011177, partial [Alternaria burnsii]
FIVQESVKIGKPLIAASFNYRLVGSAFLPGASVNKSTVATLAFMTKGWRCAGFERTSPHLVEMPRV